MQKHAGVLGIDIGSVSVALAVVTLDRRLAGTAYGIHHGKIKQTFEKLLKQLPTTDVADAAATASTPAYIDTGARFDNRLSVITACRHLHPDAGAVLSVGGEKFSLIHFDENGDYAGCRSNTACAAGTGSFLDQQAQRLQLENSAALDALARRNAGPRPKIASRCAVFAKTDLVHAQQEGYDLAGICDGLCFGLAKNIVDTLFSGQSLRGPLVFCGGVAKNKAVARHISRLTGAMLIPENAPCGAVGAALQFIDTSAGADRAAPPRIDRCFGRPPASKRFFYPPLELKYSRYPHFETRRRYVFRKSDRQREHAVEVDIYEDMDRFCSADRRCDIYLGLDIGSTSTKAVILSPAQVVLAGFYTRTAGRPVAALQHLLAAVEDVQTQNALLFHIRGAGTTGAGRKFSAAVVNADMAVDEITAHARAAVALEPAVDTILEIGGQDSKFTNLQQGSVTFSVMNTVCAAGTGSFIEEQAQRLGCALSSYAALTRNVAAPLASDRCTVFMERDVNHLMTMGYTREEVLAAVLHSIVENYLTKVAVEKNIGRTVLFQGATAKNRSLVAAFEQRLKRPIRVSRFCHLTGALGVALMLTERKAVDSGFKGLGLHRRTIPIRTEVCRFCTNHCKITTAEVEGRTVAYGFLCGRDYDTRHYVENNRSGFDLLKARRRVLAPPPADETASAPVIGLPAGLHMIEDLPFWKMFFAALGLQTQSSEDFADALKTGRRLAGAEFCAPMTAMHGHVQYLLDRTDAVFLPYYMDHHNKDQGGRRQYCYYTQYMPSLAAGMSPPAGSRTQSGRLLTPLIRYLYSTFHTRLQLHRMLQKMAAKRYSFAVVSAAFDRAAAFQRSRRAALKALYRRHTSDHEGLHVVLLGRPYTILSRYMNKGIPTLFGAMGIPAFYQDMLPVDDERTAVISPLLREFHWHYAAEIIKAALTMAETPGAYPVLITSFKCSPDAFVIDRFKDIMAAHAKPYLILQLDEHDSSVGYETRIEAAVRSFTHHYRKAGSAVVPREPVQLRMPEMEKELDGRTLAIPGWDRFSQRLMVANLRKEGIDAHLLPESQDSIRKSLRYNTGQCIPLNIIAQAFVDFMKSRQADPARTVLWLVSASIPCNLKLFSSHIKNLLPNYGRAFEKAGVYTGTMSFADLSLRLPINTYFAYMFGGFLKKIGCRIRPDEKIQGATDQALADSLTVLEEAFLGRRKKEAALAEVIALLEGIKTRGRPRDVHRPKVAVFGDLYVRDNDILNQNLIHTIEAGGGQVVTTPYSSYIKMIAKPYLRKWFVERRYANVLSSKALITAISLLEKKYLHYFARILKEPEPLYDEAPEAILKRFHLRIEHTGESMENILKIYYTLKHHPDIALFVQTSPAFCCPSLVTEAMAGSIEAVTGVPIVSITYDGTGGDKNDIIIPYLRFAAERRHRRRYYDLKERPA